MSSDSDRLMVMHLKRSSSFKHMVDSVAVNSEVPEKFMVPDDLSHVSGYNCLEDHVMRMDCLFSGHVTDGMSSVDKFMLFKFVEEELGGAFRESTANQLLVYCLAKRDQALMAHAAIKGECLGNKY